MLKVRQKTNLRMKIVVGVFSWEEEGTEKPEELEELAGLEFQLLNTLFTTQAQTTWLIITTITITTTTTYNTQLSLRLLLSMLRKQRRLRKKFQRMNKEGFFSEEEETEEPEESEKELKPQLFMSIITLPQQSITSTPITTTIMSYINMLRRRCQRKVVTNHHFGGYPIPNTGIIWIWNTGLNLKKFMPCVHPVSFLQLEFSIFLIF